MFVKPAPGLKVRDPQTHGFLPAEGASVPDTLYWVRRLKDKSVIETTEAEIAAAAAAAAAPAPAPALTALTKEIK